MNKWVKSLIAATCSLLMVATTMAAEDSSNITITNSNFGDKYYKEVIWFSDYDLGNDAGTNTYVYNEAEGTTTSSGEVSARQYDIAKTIQIRVGTLGSTSVNARIEGRAGTATQWGELDNINFTVGTTTDYIVDVTEFVEEIRVGLMANGTAGTDTITVTGAMMGSGR